MEILWNRGEPGDERRAAAERGEAASKAGNPALGSSHNEPSALLTLDPRTVSRARPFEDDEVCSTHKKAGRKFPLGFHFKCRYPASQLHLLTGRTKAAQRGRIRAYANSTDDDDSDAIRGNGHARDNDDADNDDGRSGGRGVYLSRVGCPSEPCLGWQHCSPQAWRMPPWRRRRFPGPSN